MKNILRILLILAIIGVPCGTHAAKKDLTDNTTYNTPSKSFGAADANDTELYDILSGTEPTLGPLNIGGTGDSWLQLYNNTTLVDDYTAKYGIRFYDGALYQVINGTGSLIGSGGSGYTTYPTYSDDTCTQGQYSFGTTPAPEMKCRATNTWDYLVVSGAALVWADWDNPEPTLITPVARWNLDDGVLTVDSVGTNTLTNNNAVTNDNVDYKEGDASGVFVASSTQSLSIANTSLDSGFPLKLGDTTKTISVTFWVKLTSVSAKQTFYGIYDESSSQRVFKIGTGSTISDSIYITIGAFGGAGSRSSDPSNTLVIDRWYHVGATYQDDIKTWTMRIWDDTAGAIVTNASGVVDEFINVGTSQLFIGNQTNPSLPTDSQMDDVRVFTQVLTEAQIDAVRGDIP